jgi:hypothetical protein
MTHVSVRVTGGEDTTDLCGLDSLVDLTLIVLGQVDLKAPCIPPHAALSSSLESINDSEAF